MDNYPLLKSNLLEIRDLLVLLFNKAKQIPTMYDPSFEEWEAACQTLDAQLEGEIIRIAVAGPIKSGKSTFVNSFLKADHLKRGAGVVTSIVTRIRRGNVLKAQLFFKSWDMINAEMERALVLFPSLNLESAPEGFDIRNPSHRDALRAALDALGTEHMIRDDTRDTNTVLLTAYLKGYDQIENFISTEPVTHEYEGDHFQEHQKFVGNDELATYLSDVRLDITDQVYSNVEIADCQGSDSANPLHLAKIQDYLVLIHLIVYVISSRTGLRQADIKFLNIIRKMGIIDNTLFVVNVDFSEHESFSNLESIVNKIQDDLAWVKPEPRIFAISALYNLFRDTYATLSEKDRIRWDTWQKDIDMVQFSHRSTKRFISELEQTLKQKRDALLVKNHLARLEVMLSAVDHRIKLNRGILQKNATDVDQFVQDIHQHRQKMNLMEATIKRTLDGTIHALKQELRTDTDRFFDIQKELLKNIFDFIKNFTLSDAQYENYLKKTDFSGSIYLVFQEFKQAFDTFMTETINPEIIHFIRDEEQKIQDHMKFVSNPNESLLNESLEDYREAMSRFGIPEDPIRAEHPIEFPDMDALKRKAKVNLPAASLAMQYSMKKITSEAVMRLGYYSLVNALKRLFKKPVQVELERKQSALKNGLRRIKKETEESLHFHFKDIQENFKFQYLFKLADAFGVNLYESMIQRFQGYTADLSRLVEHIRENRFEKGDALKVLDAMDAESAIIQEKIKQLLQEIA